MVLSAIWFAITYLFVKLCTGKFPFFLFTFIRFLLPCLLMLAVLLIQKRFQDCFRVKRFHTHLLRAIFVTITQFSIFYYLSQGSLMNGTVLLNTGPLFIPLISWLFLGYKLTKTTIVSLFIAFIGVVLILQPGTELFTFLSLMGLLAGFTQACSQVLYGIHVKEERVVVNLFLLFFLCSCISIFPLLISYFGFSYQATKYTLLFTSNEWHLLFLLITLASANVLTQYYRGQAYSKGGKPSKLSSFLYLGVLFAAFFDWLVFDLTPNLYSILGALLVMGSTILRIYHHRSIKQTNSRDSFVKKK